MKKLNAIGFDIRHIGEFCIDRPYGSGDYLIVVFKTDAFITIDNKEIIAPPDSAIIYSKGHKQHYRTICENYVNHFLHFSSDLIDNSYDESSVKYDTLLIPEDIVEIERIFQQISREHISVSDKKFAYIDMLITMLLMKLSEEKKRNDIMTDNSHSRTLNSLRANIYSNAGQFTSISQLASSVNISPSYFQKLYTQQFGISCYDDLLSAKIKTAQFYLGSTDLSITEIAALCGYDTNTCFMRRFKERTQLTPTQYRKIILSEHTNKQ